MKKFDCIIIGGGPAGLSAGLYLARFKRSVLILDKESGRWDSFEKNQNYLGFPEGIHARQLRDLGIKQVQNFGVDFVVSEVTEIEEQGVQDYAVITADTTYHAKTLILATGVRDIFPTIPDIDQYIGKSLFWCITCDGWKTIDKRVCIIGQDNDAIVSCMQFTNFTKDLIFLTNADSGDTTISNEYKDRLKRANIPFIEGCIQQFSGSAGMLEKILLTSGEEIAADIVFSHQGAIPNTDLAKSLGVELDKQGYILTDLEQRTNKPYIFAAGDITKYFAHQIVTAAHEGATAACSINYDLYEPDQKYS